MLFNFRAAGKRAPRQTPADIHHHSLSCDAVRYGFSRVSAADLRDGRRICRQSGRLPAGRRQRASLLHREKIAARLLYELGVMGWFLLGTIPMGGILFYSRRSPSSFSWWAITGKHALKVIGNLRQCCSAQISEQNPRNASTAAGARRREGRVINSG